MSNLQETLSLYKNRIEAYLQYNCSIYPEEPQQELFASMRYSLLAGGKRLRPVFVYDFCRMCGGDLDDATPFAAAVEMIHTYSLIHDDLPCMDNDDFRRGKPTNHKKYGEAIAVLAGDALLTAAFSQIANSSLSADSRIQAVQILADLSGELGMVGGQILDIQSETRQCTKQEVIDIQTRKTGALIQAACMLGVLAGQGSEEQLFAAREFAAHIGLAFQIRDDVLDVIGNPEELGKATGSDSNKNTFVHLYGIDACNQLVQAHTDKAVEALSSFSNADFMKELAYDMTSRTV